jgi:hypothetical protein
MYIILPMYSEINVYWVDKSTQLEYNRKYTSNSN